MNYNLRTLCANFSRGNSTSYIVPGSVWGLFHCFPSSHTKSQQSETITFLTVLLQPIFSSCREWEPSGPCWQVWIISVIFSLKYSSNKEDTYYHSQTVPTQSDLLTPACPTGHYSVNVASKLHTHSQTVCSTLTHITPEYGLDTGGRHAYINLQNYTSTQTHIHTQNEHQNKAIQHIKSLTAHHGRVMYVFTAFGMDQSRGKAAPSIQAVKLTYFKQWCFHIIDLFLQQETLNICCMTHFPN